MEMVNTSIQRIALHLSLFSPKIIENNYENQKQLTNFEFVDVTFRRFDIHTLYIVTMSSPDHAAILNSGSNFLIITNLESEIQKLVGPQTNVILVSAPLDYFKLSNYIQGYFSANTRFGEFSSLLLAELEHGNRLKNYLNLLSEYMGNPVTLLDSSLHLVARSDEPDNVSDPIWEFLQPGGAHVENAAVRRYLKQDLPDLFPTLEYPVFYEEEPLQRRILTALKINSVNSYVLEILENGKSLLNADLAFAFSTALFLQFHMTSQYHSFRQDSVNTLIEDIATGRETDEYRLYNRAEALNFLPGSENYLLLVYADHNIGFQQMLQTVHELRELSRSTAVLLGNEILVILQGKGYQDVVTHKIVPYLNKQKCFKCSFSAMFSSISTLKAAYDQCCAAKNLGAVLAPNGSWFDYEAYRELHFVTHNLTDADIDVFCLPVAKEIVQYDRINKTRSAYTLMLYLKNFKNAAMVARIMHTHRNTMFYRLEKTAEQFGLNYDDPVQMNNLSLSFNILATRYPDIFS